MSEVCEAEEEIAGLRDLLDSYGLNCDEIYERASEVYEEGRKHFDRTVTTDDAGFRREECLWYVREWLDQHKEEFLMERKA